MLVRMTGLLISSNLSKDEAQGAAFEIAASQWLMRCAQAAMAFTTLVLGGRFVPRTSTAFKTPQHNA